LETIAAILTLLQIVALRRHWLEPAKSRESPASRRSAETTDSQPNSTGILAREVTRSRLLSELLVSQAEPGELERAERVPLLTGELGNLYFLHDCPFSFVL
jgi:hypothetical protein